MSLSPGEKLYHDIYKRLDKRLKATADDAFAGVWDALRADGLSRNTCDGAERLIAAITRYMVESNPTILHHIQPASGSQPALKINNQVSN